LQDATIGKTLADGTMEFTIADLYLAYRKAKAEAYYENTHFHAREFTDFEESLDQNLRALLEKLNDPTGTWVSNIDLGGYSYLPKSVDVEVWRPGSEAHFRALNPLEDWMQRFGEHDDRPATAKFRLVIRASVEFQVVSALWIMKVGHKYDGVVDSTVSYGNRLRRRNSLKTDNSASSLNVSTPGLFSPYFDAYKSWRENGLRVIEDSLKADKRILAVTMDIEQFYHRVCPNFILRTRFLSKMGIRLTAPERLFTKSLIQAINNWYATTPDYAVRPQGALPVGLSASKIIANVLLCEFDRTVLQKLRPLYYGRYVDDVFLVLRDNSKAVGSRSVVSLIARKLSPLARTLPAEHSPASLEITLDYAKDSRIVFAGPKQKIFALAPPHGLDLVEHIREQIRIQSSEHRLLPDVPEYAAGMAARALLATPDASLQVDALRKADVVSVRRLGLALLLRDIESYAADLSPDEWKDMRAEFYGLVTRHVITPLGFFDFFGYIHRVFGLMLSCEDYVQAESLILDLRAVADVLLRTTNAGKAEMRPQFDACLSHYALALAQAGLQAASVRRIRKLGPDFLSVVRRLRALDQRVSIPQNLTELRRLAHGLLLSDWGRRPYKDYWYLDQREHIEGPPVPPEPEIRRVLRLGAIRRFRERSTELQVKQPYWPALAFPTRPLRIDEIALAARAALEDARFFEKCVEALRGAKVVSSRPFGVGKAGDRLLQLRIPNPQPRQTRIAITSVRTTEEQFVAAARGAPDRSLVRYTALNRLVNNILSERPSPQYLVFPELSIPIRWALRISRKLARSGISVIAGVEYYRDGAGNLRNDCLVSLVTNWPGYSTNVSRLQPKFEPAHPEKEELSKLGLQLFMPQKGDSKPTVYAHGGVCFSVLICSDLTNIDHRFALRGHVDALFALEWNRDVRTFSALVESTANDLHAFVIQVNNRSYGDSRIRSPATNDFARDIVQVKGGEADYYVIGEIDCGKLRREQRDSKSDKFKPAPIGFQMSDRRKGVTVDLPMAWERRKQKKPKTA
jgi:hypothetical protein